MKPTKLLLSIPTDINYSLSVLIAKMKLSGQKITKHDAVIELLKTALKEKL